MSDPLFRNRRRASASSQSRRTKPFQADPDTESGVLASIRAPPWRYLHLGQAPRRTDTRPAALELPM